MLTRDGSIMTEEKKCAAGNEYGKNAKYFDEGIFSMLWMLSIDRSGINFFFCKLQMASPQNDEVKIQVFNYQKRLKI